MARILLVEDNELNRDMLAERLELRGHEVLVAADGAQAVTMAHSARPDAILMDMSLPVLDGWEATRRIKAAPDTHAVPIIALTAHVMPGDQDRCLEAGCDAYEEKPVDFPRLLATLQSLLDKSPTL